MVTLISVTMMSSKQYIMSQQGCTHYLLDYDQGRGNFKWYNSVHADVHTYVCIAPEASEKLLTSLVCELASSRETGHEVLWLVEWVLVHVL